MTTTEVTTDGSCGLSWDDSEITTMTPAPSGRCPFEYFHEYDDMDECVGVREIPINWPVQPITT